MVDMLSKAIRAFPVAVKQTELKALISFLVFSVTLSCPIYDRNMWIRKKGTHHIFFVAIE